ncbi:MAG TPA: hypothetical protein VFH48_10945 [Chloroflexota bacterium]|nr:hypothetical protein [Chloroflexota bacterium]
MEHASTAAIADAVERPAPRLRPFAEPATLLVLLALAAAVVHFFLLITDYRALWVHPDNHQFILKESLRGGAAIGLIDFPNSLQLRAPDEFRPRFLTYYLIAIDQKIRLFLYDWMPVHPTLTPVAWAANLAALYFLYRLLVSMTGDRLAGLAGLAVYWSATGLLSGFTMNFMPGKTLSNMALIMSLYFAVEAMKRARPGQLLMESPGWSKYLLLVMIFVGLMLDEMPIALLFIVPLVVWSAFVPRFPWKPPAAQLVRFVKNGLFFAIPTVAFLAFVVVIVPPITEALFDYRFDFLGDMLLINNTRTAPSLEAAVTGGLQPWIFVGNVTTLFGLSLVPWPVSPFIITINGTWPSGQETNLPKIVLLALFFAVTLYIAVKSTGPWVPYLRGLLVALPIFFLYLSLLMVRHVPVVTGYYYGAIFASVFALLVGLLVAGASQLVPWGRIASAVVVAAIVGVQIANYGPLNDGWRVTHDEGLTRERMAKARENRDRRIPLLAEPRDLTPDEVRAIWTAWKQDQLDRYLRDNKVSSAAVYEVVELQDLDRARGRRPGQ